MRGRRGKERKKRMGDAEISFFLDRQLETSAAKNLQKNFLCRT